MYLTLGETLLAQLQLPSCLCNLHLNLKDSDEAHQEFATFYLKHLYFLYQESDGNDPGVSTLFYLTDEVYA